MPVFKAGVTNGCCNYILSSSGFYRRMIQIDVGAKDIATVSSNLAPNPNLAEGSVFFALKSRDDINKIEDLKGKIIAANDINSFSGFHIGMGSIAEKGFNPDNFFRETHEVGVDTRNVLDELIRGNADVGVLRTCTLEQVPSAFDTFKIISPYSIKNFNCVTSTKLYPNWTFSSLPSATPELTREVARALFSMPKLDNGLQWGIASDFTEVDKLFRELKIGPYSYLRTWTWERLFEEHRQELLLLFMMIIGAVIHSIRATYLIKKATDKIKQANELEQKVREESQKMMTQLERIQRNWVVDQIGTIYAHELKQPLASISAYAFGLLKLLDRQVPLDLRLFSDKLSNIHQAAKDAATTMERLHTYVRGSSEPSVINVLADIKEISNHLINSQRKNINVSYVGSDSDCFVFMQKIEFDLLFHNIIKNAIEAIKNNDGKLMISMFPLEDERITIQISDNGGELSDSELRNIKSPLTKSTKSNGMGFGLSISKSIVEKNSGEIIFDNIRGVGLKVTVTLPSYNH